VHYNIT